jgi:hypothetical protein
MRNDIYKRLENEPYPCKYCEYKQRCAIEELACRRFLWYINEERWVCAQQDEPTKKMFQMVFDPNNEESMQTYLRNVRKRRRKGQDVEQSNQLDV